jgi:hypothetical protein
MHAGQAEHAKNHEVRAWVQQPTAAIHPTTGTSRRTSWWRQARAAIGGRTAASRMITPPTRVVAPEVCRRRGATDHADVAAERVVEAICRTRDLPAPLA